MLLICVGVLGHCSACRNLIFEKTLAANSFTFAGALRAGGLIDHSGLNTL